MSKFIFETDAETYAYCEQIVAEMMQLFGIAEAEALGRVNRHWRGQSLVGAQDDLGHDLPEWWAKGIYFPPNVPWWNLDERTLKPRQYPD